VGEQIERGDVRRQAGSVDHDPGRIRLSHRQKRRPETPEVIGGRRPQ